ncbi:MAG: hypothetical protein U0235_28465 [Polyangiaceae bacterium]
MKARVALAALALFGLSSTAAFAGKAKLLSIGELIATAPTAKGKLGLVRTTIEQELDTIDWRKPTKNKPYVVSVSVVSLATETTREKVATTCELSTTVRSARDGAVVVILNQRARAENEPAYARSVEDGAIRAATTAAIRKIPAALAEAKK